MPLVLVNLIPLPAYTTTMVLHGPEGTTLPHEEALDEVRETAGRAADLGVKTELLRVRTKRPVTALLEVVSERDQGCSCSVPTSIESGAFALLAPPGAYAGTRAAWCGSRRTARRRAGRPGATGAMGSLSTIRTGAPSAIRTGVGRSLAELVPPVERYYSDPEMGSHF